MKISKEANEKAELLKSMLGAMTGKKIVFKAVKAIPIKPKKKGKK